VFTKLPLFLYNLSKVGKSNQRNPSEKEKIMPANEMLRVLIDTRDQQVQRARVAFGNRVSAIERGVDASSEHQKGICQRYLLILEDMEKQMNKDIKEAVKDEAIYAIMSNVKGVGPTLSGKLLAQIDIDRANTVSGLWRYCGFAVFDGKREKLKAAFCADCGAKPGKVKKHTCPVTHKTVELKGEKAHFNKRLKTACYLVGCSFLKSGSPYRAIYDTAKARYQANHPDWTKLHAHNAAMGNMIKAFLADLWIEWRTLKGLPTRQPYAMEYGGHTTLRDRTAFGWPPDTRANAA
jgi:hypothetical protein